MEQVYVLHHVVLLPPEYEQELEKLVGIYRSEEAALEAVNRLRKQKGFKEHPNIIDYDAEHPDFQGFSIDSYELDKDYWPNGYDINEAI